MTDATHHPASGQGMYFDPSVDLEDAAQCPAHLRCACMQVHSTATTHQFVALGSSANNCSICMAVSDLPRPCSSINYLCIADADAHVQVQVQVQNNNLSCI